MWKRISWVLLGSSFALLLAGLVIAAWRWTKERGKGRNRTAPIR